GNALAARTIAVIAYSPATNLPNPLDASVPVLINMGGLDLKFGNPIHLDKLILAARAQGAPWLGLFQAKVPHNGHGDPAFVMDWTRWVVQWRVPETIPADAPVQLKPLAIEEGWLGRMGFNSDLNDPHPEGPDAVGVRAFSQGRAGTSYWLPNESLAWAWKEYCLRPDVRFVNGMGEEPVLRNASFVNSIGMRLVRIPAGHFLMGSAADEEQRAEDETSHPVTITKPFYMAATEVTQAQWQKVMGSNPSGFLADVNPVEKVSHDQAREFCNALSRLEGRTYRLPTEAEWEYACRAGTTTPFHFGWSIDTDLANYRGDVGYGGGTAGMDRRRSCPVALFPANAWGLYDMHGNVFEWCADWYGAYPTEAVSDPKGPQTGTQRVFRGGAWYTLPQLTRAAFRGMSAPGYKSLMVGFRVVVDKEK
ncbi:MAG: formylglycine-generating enzyme family protein, partial [Verrucomicrobia bacterium]|nr:formylglycine-generating enzyme family protein [Verrucomicrobiota bacterium]